MATFTCLLFAENHIPKTQPCISTFNEVLLDLTQHNSSAFHPYKRHAFGCLPLLIAPQDSCTYNINYSCPQNSY